MRKIPENSTPVINAIFEKLAKVNLSSYEVSILMAVIRKTYGWDKKNDWISGSQLSEATGILSNHCYRTVKKLVKKGILIKDGRLIGVNKKVHEWVVPERVLVHEQVVPKRVPQPTQTCTKKVPELVHTKETITKETITKESTPAQIARSFFSGEIDKEKIVKYFIEKNVDEDVVRNEIEKFTLYWTEPNKSGTKVRWELQQTFDVKRRLWTWIHRSSKFSKPSKSIKSF